MTSQAGRGRPGRVGLRRCLGPAGLRRDLRHPPVVRSEREPDEIRQPLVDQGHLPVAPRQHPGEPQHGLLRLSALFERERVRRDQEVLVLPVRDRLDGQSQALAKLLVGHRALIPPAGDERGHAMPQQRRPALAQKGIRQPGSIGVIRAQVTGQQLSVLATRRILARIEALFNGHLPSPAELLEVDPGKLREAGLSWRKVSTLRDLAERFSDGRLNPDVLSTLPDEEVMAELTAIPGIGPWTVQGPPHRTPARRCRPARRPRAP